VNLRCLLVVTTVLVGLGNALAQTPSLSLQILGKTEDRLKQGISLAFNMRAYDRFGTGEESLGGGYSAITGAYPQVPRGTVLDPRIIARGFKRIENVWICTGERAEGKDQKSEANGLWDRDGYRYRRCQRTGNAGEYSFLWDTEGAELGPAPISWLIEHRDDRDKYHVLVFTFTWTRSGILSGDFEVFIKRAPNGFDRLRGEALLPYLTGFLPLSYGSGQPSQEVKQLVIPGQSATQTQPGQSGETIGSGLPDDLSLPKAKSGSGNTLPKDRPLPQIDDQLVVSVGFASRLSFKNGQLSDGEIESALRYPLVGDICPIGDGQAAIYVVGPSSFKAMLVNESGDTLPFQVFQHRGKFWARSHGTASNLAGLKLVIKSGRTTRTITFRKEAN